MNRDRWSTHGSRWEATFGSDTFGQAAEAIARFFGSPKYLVSLTIVVILWVSINAAALSLRWDPYPFILLNLAFSTQSAYAAPLILLAQTRQAQRDKESLAADIRHREELETQVLTLLEQNTDLTREVAHLAAEVKRATDEIHQVTVRARAGQPS
jgi:uncharacterized membrane protein